MRVCCPRPCNKTQVVLLDPLGPCTSAWAETKWHHAQPHAVGTRHAATDKEKKVRLLPRWFIPALMLATLTGCSSLPSSLTGWFGKEDKKKTLSTEEALRDAPENSNPLEVPPDLSKPQTQNAFKVPELCPPADGRSSGAESVEQKLKTLQELKAKGQITEPEYNTKRKALLEQL